MQKRSSQQTPLEQLPEAVKGEKQVVDSVFLRTVLKRNVHERLVAVAKEYGTGRGDWDFGVAIQVLLDRYDESRMALQDEKLNAILLTLEELTEKKEPERETVSLLGGHSVSKN